MLNTPSQYPHPGSTAYLRPTGQAVRIIQHNADGTRLVSLAGKQGAAANFTTTAAELAETQMEAIGPAKRRHTKAGAGA